MPFAPEMQFDNRRPLSPQEVEDIATRASIKAISVCHEKEPGMPALFWFYVGVVTGAAGVSLFLLR
jgi:hypothetical protein